ncbi:MAG: threonine--tRNA ligase [Proteobacteria bacterium]|nr:threonine--tRNA ligase [Pseudomonadota bacterium]MDA0926907.1 threonine--tRNA ligase [Pseudomonadota bacterium]
MPQITLPDGSKRDYEGPVTIAAVAESIGPGLAKAALAGRVNGELVDTSYTIDTDANLAIVTERDDDGLEVLRHSCAHLMAQAVQRLFPKAQVTIGPVIEDGFFYDFSFHRPFTPEDLVEIEKTMQEIVKENHEVERSVLGREEAIALFKEMGEEYKVEIISSIPGDEPLSFYKQGEFIDLCRGPHVPNTGKFKAFKLTSVAGAYWRGNSDNEMLQRIYGTAWASKQDLKDYLQRLEEAEKRDHRKLGKQLQLFHFQEEAPGMPFWHPKGWTIYQTIQDYMQQKQRAHNYLEINTPQLVDYSLWEKSGHAAKFSEEMFSVESDSRMYAIKPMNCPCHVQVFNQGLKSYRDLPMRLAEFGSCHRYEPSGSMHGLMRVRSFVQDDGHIFCTEDQIQTEVADFMDLLFEVYRDFGFDDIILRLSTRPEKRVGSDEIWDEAEKALTDALNATGLEWQLQPGEGAFYGPKIEYSLKDCMGRTQQCGTIQVDFFTPGRLGAEYVTEDSSRKTPVMLHRAVLGSFERFIGVLIEHYAGAMPTWLAPEQAVILNITDRQAEYCGKLEESLKNKGFRAVSDLRNEKIGFKIREHTLQKIPYLLVVGDKEVESGTVAVRTRGGEDLGTMTFEDFCDHLNQDIARFGRS